MKPRNTACVSGTDCSRIGRRVDGETTTSDEPALFCYLNMWTTRLESMMCAARGKKGELLEPGWYYTCASYAAIASPPSWHNYARTAYIRTNISRTIQPSTHPSPQPRHLRPSSTRRVHHEFNDFSITASRNLHMHRTYQLRVYSTHKHLYTYEVPVYIPHSHRRCQGSKGDTRTRQPSDELFEQQERTTR